MPQMTTKLVTSHAIISRDFFHAPPDTSARNNLSRLTSISNFHFAHPSNETGHNQWQRQHLQEVNHYSARKLPERCRNNSISDYMFPLETKSGHKNLYFFVIHSSEGLKSSPLFIIFYTDMFGLLSTYFGVCLFWCLIATQNCIFLHEQITKESFTLVSFYISEKKCYF